ncbi:MAG: LysR family transcriptional regulator [Gammaproteobacteria bacterium]|nr:LysR family transcriptional regulator [Gammaproteobacteria bacterium]MBU0787965.1 LysR family transcriptional regulator [Gammaproteobacteria bacterium]MBU0815537.1 LysR family transcriptional regulator [Gammaproteobacteria bacterium]MBU1785355.1 LysR family transcriptional regulator [Gammaproteobacteria bacterium]
MDFDELRIFSRVADLASFSRAAEQLGLAKGHVSTSVRQLEARLGTRLLQRTTRSVRLTQDGERFLERCREFLVEAEQLQAMFQPASGGLTGRLRIDLPHILARDVIIPRLPEFLSAHPRLEVGISTTDRRVDLVHEGFDCILRVGALGDSDLVARPLGLMQMSNAASPAYLREHGTPQTLADLAQHRVVHYTHKLTANDAGWEYFDKTSNAARTLPMPAAISVNGTDAYQAAALAGLGLIQAPTLGLQRRVDEGTLVLVMPDFTAPPMPVSLLYANRHQLAPRVLAVMNWLSRLLTPYLLTEQASSPGV